MNNASTQTIFDIAAAAQLDGQAADDLFLVALDGAETWDENAGRDTIELIGAFTDDRGFTAVQTRGHYADGENCTGLHVRDADGEFVAFVAAA